MVSYIKISIFSASLEEKKIIYIYINTRPAILHKNNFLIPSFLSTECVFSFSIVFTSYCLPSVRSQLHLWPNLDYLIINLRENFKLTFLLKVEKLKDQWSVFQIMVLIIALSKGKGYLYILIFKMLLWKKVKALLKSKQH